MLADRLLPADEHGDRLHSDQLGSLGEFALDRANLTGSGGRLFPYLPIVDTHGVDRAYAWDGRGPISLVQVKTADATVPSATYEWSIHGGTFTPYDHFWFTLLVLNPLTGDAGNDCFHVPSVAAARLASPRHPGASRYLLQGSFVNPCKLSPYRRRLQDLWMSFAPPGAAPGRFFEPRPEPPADTREAIGGMFQLLFVTELMQASEVLLAFKPLNDLAGRNVLVQLVGTPHVLFVEVKGRRRRHSQHSIEIPVPRSTFIASPDFWLVFYYFDEERQALFDDCWLVPSLDFERRTVNQADRHALNFQADLLPERDQWRNCRQPLKAQREVIIAALRSQR